MRFWTSNLSISRGGKIDVHHRSIPAEATSLYNMDLSTLLRNTGGNHALFSRQECRGRRRPLILTRKKRKYPNVKIVLSHLGGNTVWLAPRIT
ncbi:hypothetical protein BD309DRAFT_957037 [Dichomitus squalens]|nr:hypothetical protein BD309DRAFT_957037 [Dichomitus squalens]